MFPLIGDYAYGNNYGDARAQGRHAGIDIERVPWRTPVVAAEAGPDQVVDDLVARGLHALPLRQERHDVPLYPPEQRPHGEVGGQGRVQARRRVRGRGRREGDRRRADRVPRRLRRRGREPPPPLRGPPERRRGRQSVPVPQRGRAPAVPRQDRDVVLAGRARHPGRGRRAGRSSFGRRRCAGGPVGSGRRSSASAPSPSPSRRAQSWTPRSSQRSRARSGGPSRAGRPGSS